MSTYSGWLLKFLNKIALKKQALDKLPDEELNGVIPGFNPPSTNQDPQMADPSLEMPVENSESEVQVSGNVFEVNINGLTFPVRLIPELVTNGPTPSEVPSSGATANPMEDTALNPNADPQALAQWMQDPNNEKAYSNQEQGTVEPLSAEEEGISVHDTGSENELAQQQNEPKIPVHKKPKPKLAAATITPGADKSTPYYPCNVCANYDAANNKCIQGLDVEKVQAAKSCSWLNSNFKPFGEDGKIQNSDGQRDQENYNNDISKGTGGGGDSGQRSASRTKLDGIWRK